MHRILYFSGFFSGVIMLFISILLWFKMGVRKALASHNMKFIGTPHRGIDDVKNIARLLPFIIL